MSTGTVAYVCRLPLRRVVAREADAEQVGRVEHGRRTAKTAAHPDPAIIVYVHETEEVIFLGFDHDDLPSKQVRRVTAARLDSHGYRVCDQRSGPNGPAGPVGRAGLGVFVVFLWGWGRLLSLVLFGSGWL